jgi:L-cysteate sulfo-lyase
MFGTSLEFRPAGLDMNAEAMAATEKLAAAGRKPYFIPGGGSNEIGALGYVSCAYELLDQIKANNLDVGWIVLATGSAGTHAGMLAGLHAAESTIPVMGISVRQPEEKQIAAVHKLAVLTAAQLTDTPLGVEKVIVDDGYVGAGYGQPTQGTLDAINLIARREGLLFDPVYSGKGLAGMIGLAGQNFFESDKDVIFLHTGGAAALFAYGNQLAENAANR